MITHETVRQLALALPEAQEHDHWGRPSSRVRKKIFATTWPGEQRAVLKLTPAEQQHLVATDPVTFSPIPGAWGQKGWTFVQFD
ncbi:MAG: MmcQ/YjbR family DNA-binding protein, partial [Cytophagaceae bacterium]|nr:MmcQ/YjbR family DNA-binding protein [Cytophagaceae bacterium]